MLDLYWGEFLVQPAPLELSLDRCSNNCAYCFANLNQPARKAKVTSVANLIAEFQHRETIQAHLLREGYPVVVSNKSDPFSKSNAPQMIPLLEQMTKAGIRVAIQTKGGLPAYEALDFLPPSAWYVTITTLNADLAAKIEPGAPAPDERLALIYEAHNKGHKVILGFNPFVPEWAPDPVELILEAKAAGAYGVWLERLHFTTRQIKRMAPWARDVMGENLLERGRKKRPGRDEVQAFYDARQAVLDAGLQLYSKAQPTASGFFQPWYELYDDKLFPTWQDFVNFMYYVYGNEWGLTSFADFHKLFSDDFPKGTWPIDSYFGAMAHNLWWTHKVPTRMTYDQVLALAWGEPRLSICPARLPAFAMAARKTEDGWVGYVDEDGLPILVWGGGYVFDGYYVDVTQDEKVVDNV